MDNNNKTVLACIDGSNFSRAVCDYAAWIAQRVGAPLKLLHNIEHREAPAVSDLTGSIGLGSREKLLAELTDLEQRRSKILLQEGKLMLEAAKERVIAAGVSDPVVNQRHGGLTEALIELEDDIGVLVMGIRGEEHENQAGRVGAHLETIIRSLHRPVLVVNGEFSAPQRIMLAYDGSEAAGKALNMVAESPLYKGLCCHVVHVSRDGKANEQVLEQAVQRLRNAGVDVVASKLTGAVEQELCDYQRQHDIDLTVMGAYSHTRLRELLLGSFTAKMLTMTQKPLLLLR
ncbi:universal stress protein [Hahella sp. KA22]|uniref:universal stress protein n=1 Tax=Hahella sp. KA22 TaxID=1628392 RepID=UPI000FDD8946|nr:universal stress protein [Hahella sp. KA22]AZZ91775.1 universal stress protein [Hahella sp. KA22]QAY55145.1 universal stress protein [Hahella sp. KA22]